MIRLATAADIPLIRERLSGLRHPPYYPDDQGIQDLIDTEVFLVDDALGAISNWHFGRGIVRGRYVLAPPGVSIAQLTPLLRETWRECARRWLKSLDARVEGDFYRGAAPKDRAKDLRHNEAECKLWQEALTRGGTGPVVDESRVDGALCIRWKLRDALGRVEELTIHG